MWLSNLVEKRSSMANWSDSEVSTLIELWGEEDVKEQLKGAKRNKHVYEKIARGDVEEKQ